MKVLKAGIENIPWVNHGFFTRQGGVSSGIYDALNCAWSSGDDPDNVRANREKVANNIGISIENLVTLRQRHSPDTLVVTAPWMRENMPEGDALVTDKPGLGLGILTADCAPVLFAARTKKVIGAAHAGWKGALTGVLDSTVRKMRELGAEPGDITAVIGPCIGPQSYEVREDFSAPFLEQDSGNTVFFRKAEKAGHLIFDLPGYVSARLKQAGVREIVDTREDTLANEKDYFSYRRTTKRGEPDYGRQMSIIALKA